MILSICFLEWATLSLKTNGQPIGNLESLPFPWTLALLYGSMAWCPYRHVLLVAALTEAFLHRSELSAFCFQKPHPLWNFREIWYLTETLNGSASQQEDIMLCIRRESWYRRKGRYIVSLIFEWQKSTVPSLWFMKCCALVLHSNTCQTVTILLIFILCTSVHVITAKHHKTKVRANSCLHHEEEMKNKSKMNKHLYYKRNLYCSIRTLLRTNNV